MFGLSLLFDIIHVEWNARISIGAVYIIVQFYILMRAYITLFVCLVTSYTRTELKELTYNRHDCQDD